MSTRWAAARRRSNSPPLQSRSAAGYVGGLSTDFFGEDVAAALTANGVSMDYVSRLERPSMLAFVDLKAEEPRYAFYDAEGAPRNWRLEDMSAVARHAAAGPIRRAEAPACLRRRPYVTLRQPLRQIKAQSACAAAYAAQHPPFGRCGS